MRIHGYRQVTVHGARRDCAHTPHKTIGSTQSHVASTQKSTKCQLAERMRKCIIDSRSMIKEHGPGAWARDRQMATSLHHGPGVIP